MWENVKLGGENWWIRMINVFTLQSHRSISPEEYWFQYYLFRFPLWIFLVERFRCNFQTIYVGFIPVSVVESIMRGENVGMTPRRSRSTLFALHHRQSVSTCKGIKKSARIIHSFRVCRQFNVSFRERCLRVSMRKHQVFRSGLETEGISTIGATLLNIAGFLAESTSRFMDFYSEHISEP